MTNSGSKERLGYGPSAPSPSESQKVLYQLGKNYYKLKVFTGCKRRSTDVTDEPFIKFVVGISSYKQFNAPSDNICC